MKDYLEEFLAPFRQAPVVDIVGVVVGRFDNLQSPQGMFHFAFEVWRDGNGEIHPTQLPVMMVAPQSDIDKLAELIRRKHKAIHIQAQIIVKDTGHQSALLVKLIGPRAKDEELNELRREIMEPITLNLPPFPPLRMTKTGWSGTATLPSWAGFGPAANLSKEHSEGRFYLNTMNEARSILNAHYKGVPPTPAQIAAYSYLVEDEEKIRDDALQAIFEQYPQWQKL